MHFERRNAVWFDLKDQSLPSRSGYTFSERFLQVVGNEDQFALSLGARCFLQGEYRRQF